MACFVHFLLNDERGGGKIQRDISSTRRDNSKQQQQPVLSGRGTGTGTGNRGIDPGDEMIESFFCWEVALFKQPEHQNFSFRRFSHSHFNLYSFKYSY